MGWFLCLCGGIVVSWVDEVRTEVFWEVGEGWDSEVWEELGGLSEEGVHGVVEAAQVGIGGAGHSGRGMWMQCMYY